MKLTILSVAAALALSSTVHVLGQDGEQRRRPFPNPIVTALDLNQDGTIDEQEIQQSAASLKTLDKNNDGKLTTDEMAPQFDRRGGPQQPGGESMAARLQQFDEDHDGLIAKDELPERMRGMVDRGDTDKDGKLSKDEITAMTPSSSGDRPGRGEHEDDDHEDNDHDDD